MALCYSSLSSAPGPPVLGFDHDGGRGKVGLGSASLRCDGKWLGLCLGSPISCMWEAEGVCLMPGSISGDIAPGLGQCWNKHTPALPWLRCWSQPQETCSAQGWYVLACSCGVRGYPAPLRLISASRAALHKL